MTVGGHRYHSPASRAEDQVNNWILRLGLNGLKADDRYYYNTKISPLQMELTRLLQRQIQTSKALSEYQKQQSGRQSSMPQFPNLDITDMAGRH
jgi:hypothetical protein